MKNHKLALIAVALVTISACGEKAGNTSSSIVSPPAAPVSSPATPAAFVEQLTYPLKVKDIGLGLVRVPCTPKEETYVDILQKPVRVQFECSIGTGADTTDIVFSGDGKKVVRVTRNQYLTPSDPEPGEVVKAAINFYGSPKDFSEGNWLANYGDAYTISYNGNAASTSRNEAGSGLLIKGYLCADGNYGTVKCGSLGTRLIKYDLIDVDGFKQQMEDGKAGLASKNQDKVNSQKF
jgi:hypothetical protein